MSTSSYSQVWQASVPQVAWGTIALFVVIVTGYPLVIGSALNGVMPYPVATLICTWLCYACFTVMHDAGHGSIFTLDSKYKKLEDIMGWIVSVPLLLGAYRFFQKMHDRHHAYTNDPDRDPDGFQDSGKHGWLQLLFRIYYIPTQYYVKLMTVYRHDPACKATYKSSIIYFVAVHGTGLLLALNGYFIEALCFAIIPMTITLFLLVLFFDYLPHHPHQSLDASNNTRMYPSRILNVLLFGQNYHLVHHLYPRVPWYKYQEAYFNMQSEFEANNAPIEDVVGGARPGFLRSPVMTELLDNGNRIHMRLRVDRITQLTADSVTIRFALPQGETLNFKPGQYITLSKWLSDRLQTRCYSICSTPGENHLTIAVRKTENGVFSQYLNETLKVGDELVVQGPFGDFTYSPQQSKAQQLHLIAGGSGITPMMPIIQAAIANHTKVSLIYVCRSEQQVMFHEQLQQWADDHDRFNITLVLSNQGRLTEHRLTELLQLNEHLTSSEFYICGPTGLKDLTHNALKTLNISTNAIHTEHLSGLTQNEIDQGFSLACQSQPKSDLIIHINS